MTTLLPAGRHVPVVMGDGNTHYLAHTSYGDSSKLKALHVAGPATQQSLLTPALTQPLGTHTLPGLHPQAWRPVGPGSAQRAVGSTAQVAGGRVQGAAGGSRTRAASSRSALMAGSSPAQPGSGGRGQRAGSSPAQGGMPAQAASSSRVQAASTNNLWFVKAALEIAAAEARARVPGGSSSQAAASSGAGPSGAGAGQAAAGWGAAGAGPPAAGQSGAEAGQLAEIADTYHAWRGQPEARAYADVPGFCKAASLDEIRSHGHVLTPGRYVGAADVEDDDVPFEERFAALRITLTEQFRETARLQAVIETGLAAIDHDR